MFAIHYCSRIPKISYIASLLFNEDGYSACPTCTEIDTRAFQHFLSFLEGGLQGIVNLFVAMHLFNLFGFVFKILLDVIIYCLGRFFSRTSMTIVHRTIIKILLLILLLIIDAVHNAIGILTIRFLDAIALLRK